MDDKDAGKIVDGVFENITEHPKIRRAFQGLTEGERKQVKETSKRAVKKAYADALWEKRGDEQ